MCDDRNNNNKNIHIIRIVKVINSFEYIYDYTFEYNVAYIEDSELLKMIDRGYYDKRELIETRRVAVKDQIKIVNKC